MDSLQRGVVRRTVQHGGPQQWTLLCCTKAAPHDCDEFGGGGQFGYTGSLGVMARLVEAYEIVFNYKQLLNLHTPMRVCKQMHIIGQITYSNIIEL